MSLGLIFTIVLIGAVVCGAAWGLFQNGIKVLLGIIFLVALAIFVLPYLFSAIACILTSGLFWGIVIFIILAWICQMIFG